MAGVQVVTLNGNTLTLEEATITECCTGTADVIQAVQFAQTHQLPFSVRGGGTLMPPATGGDD